MKTPAIYTQNLNKHIITKRMLTLCLYSVNKRAKNHRDQERKYRHSFRYTSFDDQYNYIEKYQETKEMYYEMKEELLSILKPDCIHKIRAGDHYEYRLFFDLGDHSFHSDTIVVQAYPHLEIINIGQLWTEGKEIDTLVSVQFVRKVIALIESGDYQYIDE